MLSLSIVIPAYNEEKTIAGHIRRLLDTLHGDGLAAEVILVDDGSRDGTWGELCALSRAHDCVRAVRFSRNFGKEAAIFAGIAQVQTDACLVMDSDMQHPPRYIRPFLEEMERTGCDIVEGVKRSRGRERFLYKLFAKGFYKILSALTGVNLDNSSDFKLLNKSAIEAIRQFHETDVFFRGLVQWSGFDKVQIPFDVEERQGDTTKFSTKKLVLFAFQSMLSYTSKPLYLTVVVGLLFFLGAIVLTVNTLVHFFSGRAVSGFTTVILLDLIIGSLLLFSLGIIGAYISRIYSEIKRRPRYIIAETTDGRDGHA